MKKRLITILLLAALTVTALACLLSACFDDNSDPGGSITIVLQKDGVSTPYEVSLSQLPEEKHGLISALDLLQEQGKLTYTASDSQTGKFILTVGDLAPSVENREFIALYTSVESDFGTFEGVNELYYGDTLCKSSGVGAELLTLKDGCVILLRIETY